MMLNSVMNVKGRIRGQFNRAALALFLSAIPSPPTHAQEKASLTEKQLIEKVLEGQQSTGFITKARLVHEANGIPKSVMQLLITGRRSNQSSDYLYQLVWPRDRKGEGWLLKKEAGGEWSGFHFIPPDGLRQLNGNLLQSSFFDTNLTLFDLTNDYWNWPRHQFVGEEIIHRRTCKILESKPGGNENRSPYGRIKTWIALEGYTPMKVEVYDAGGHLLKVFHSEKVMRLNEEYWIPASVTIQDARTREKTTLSGSRSDRDVKLEDETFTVENLKNLD